MENQYNSTFVALMEEAKQIVKDIQQGNIKPIYFLMGEEAYYIDRIAEYIEEKVGLQFP